MTARKAECMKLCIWWIEICKYFPRDNQLIIYERVSCIYNVAHKFSIVLINSNWRFRNWWNFREQSNQDANGRTDGWISLEVPNRGNSGNQISGCGISRCNAKFENLKPKHARIARERNRNTRGALICRLL